MAYLEGAPLPDVSDWNTKEWWDRVKGHELTVQRCTRCKTYRHTPAPVCYKCRSFEYEWAEVSGKGTVYSYTFAFHPSHPSVSAKLPYNIVVVELPDADGVRMVGNLLDAAEGEISIGMPVEVAFDDVTDDVTLPQWKRAS